MYEYIVNNHCYLGTVSLLTLFKIMSQIFVSREVELNKLNSFLTEMLNGKTQVCFISGEPGTGKSRLIE